jgi:hypothetical protein
MRIHLEEVELARAWEREHPFEALTPDQIQSIMTRGRELLRWFRGHHRTHCLIGMGVLVFLFTADYLALLRVPGLWLTAGRNNALGPVLLAGAVSGMLHCWLMYSLGTFSIHEGGAHKFIFPPRGPISQMGSFLAGNLCRLTGGDPVDYAANHNIHHAKFGTKEDAEFLNFITPSRYWATFLPFASVVNFSDFIIHRPLRYTPSRLLSLLLTLAYQGPYLYLAFRYWGLVFLIVVLFFLTHIGFYLDRLRQYTEHNLMPLDNLNGSRSLGLGFWGMLVGGGPWGTPCHWEHHLVASIPWYQQILLHRHVVGLLTPMQRKQFLIEPVVGFPRLWWKVVRESSSFLSARK